MPYIIYQKDPAGISRAEYNEVPDNTHLMTWLSERFDTIDDMCGDLACDIILNGRVIFRNDDEEFSPEQLDFITISGNDTLSIVVRPADPVTLIVSVIAIVAVAASVYLASQLDPALPGSEAYASESPNNRLNAAQNSFRPGEAIPECFGYGVSYPDFIQPTYYYYENNVKRQIELFCISVGEIEVNADLGDEIRVAETNIDDLPSTDATLLLPGEDVDPKYLQIHQASASVSNDTMLAPDDGNIIQDNVDFNVVSNGAYTNIEIDEDDIDILYDIDLQAGGYLYIRTNTALSIYPASGSATVGNTAPSGTEILQVNGNFYRILFLSGAPAEASGEITLLTLPSGGELGDLEMGGGTYNLEATTYTYEDINGVFEVVDIDASADPVIVTIDYAASDTGSYRATLGRGSGTGVIGPGLSGELDSWIGWFDLPSDTTEEVWFHWNAPAGIRRVKDNGKNTTASVTVEFQIEALDENGEPTGNVWTQSDVVSGNTLDAQYITTRFTPDEFPGMEIGGYRARARRITDTIDTDGTSAEKVAVEAFLSVESYSNPNFGDTTRLLLIRNASLFGADQSSKKINLDYRRKLPYYNRETGEYELDNLVATNSFADAIAYTLIPAGGVSESRVDLAGLYEIYDGLSDPQLGEFTFTFDDENLSMGERVDVACNVARVTAFGENALWEFSRDEVKPIRSALFNRRSLLNNEGSQTYQLQRSDDADSVRLYYVDPDDNTEVYIERRIDVDSASIVNGESGNVVKEITLAGCRNLKQATNRADLEIRRLAYQRQTVKDTSRREALEIRLLDRVGWVDINEAEYFDGEILGFSGDTYDTTEGFYPVDGETYFVYVTDNEGYPSNTVQCFPRSDTEYGFIASGLTNVYTPDDMEQLGSRYFIATAGDITAQDFLLVKRAPTAVTRESDGYVDIELVQYDSRMYEMDDIVTPEGSALVPVGIVASDYQQSPTVATTDISFMSDGTIEYNGTDSLWHSGAASVGIGEGYQTRFTLTSGTQPTGVDFDVWVDNDNDLTLTLSQSDTGASEAVIGVEIREKILTEKVVMGSIKMVAASADVVSLPTEIIASTVGDTSEATCRLDLESNGEWLTSDSQSGNYTTIASGIGSIYEAKISNVEGNPPAGPTDEWVMLSGGGAEWTLYTTNVATTTFDLEVREIANTANTSTCSVTLNARII